MILNPYFKTLTFFLLLVSLSCSNQKIENRLYAENFSFDNGKQVVDSLDILLQKLSNIDSDDSSFSESAILINEHIRKTIEKVKSSKILNEISTPYYYKKHDFTFAISDNQKVGVFSWDTRMGESLINYKNIALFTANKKVIPTSLSGNPACYNEIYTLKSEKKHPIYIFHGWGKSSAIDFFYKVEAYNFQNEDLEEANIFPDNKNSMTSHYNIKELGFESQMDFNIEKDGSLILKPEVWGSTVVYRPIVFNGKKYGNQHLSEEKDLGHVLQEKDFEQRNSFNFLNGSELPFHNGKEGETDVYKFNDQLEIKVTNDDKKKSAEALIRSSRNVFHTVTVKDAISLIGKKNEFLFFSGSGTSRNWPLYIYNMESERIMLSKRMAKAIIKANNVLLVELADVTGNTHIGEIDCNLEYGNRKDYFDVYSFSFDKENPIVQFANHVFCGYVQ